MFIGHRVDIRPFLDLTNTLQITFDSAYERGEALRAERGHLLCWNGHYGRVRVRKAQYHFGWDWGPSFVTCGPWKPVIVEQYTSRIDEVQVHVQPSDSLDEATLDVKVRADPKLPSQSIDVELTDPHGKPVDLRQLEGGHPANFHLDRPELWYPYTHGGQPLYQVKATLKSEDGRVLDSKTQTVGIRRIELIQSPLKEGSSFYFTCNGVPIFMGGSNWIPGDTFLPRMTPDRYKRWIDLAIRGNQNMLRVWGGGIYEDDVFYDECDRRGVLVWQDFCFACGQYPWDGDFIASVKEEATQAIRRLRSHPSLAIWAGNNEDYQIANEGLSHDMTMPEGEWTNSSFGARLTYERILPDLVEADSPGALYWPGSPFGGVDNNSDRTVGDVHIWNVSSGMLLPYQRYPDITGRFVSEFGMLSCPSVATVKQSFFDSSVDDDSIHDMHPQSRAFEFHCKASSYEKRMFTCMGENFRLAFDLDTYVYLTQLLQSEAMYYAYRGWRRQFEGRECGGALVWQVSTQTLGGVPDLLRKTDGLLTAPGQIPDQRLVADGQLGRHRLLRAAQDGLLCHCAGDETPGHGHRAEDEEQPAAESPARGLLPWQDQGGCGACHRPCHAASIPPQGVDLRGLGGQLCHGDAEGEGSGSVHQCEVGNGGP